MPVVKYYRQGRFLIKETFDSSGRLLVKQSFNKDTVPDGAMAEYYPNGIIAIWRWFIPKQKKPTCGVFYHSDGTFDTLKGRPYLDMGWDDRNEPVVEIIHLPYLTTQLGYKEIYKNRAIKNIVYDPIITDSINLVPLDEYKYVKGHEYKIYFYIVDTVQKRFLFQDSTHLAER